MKKISGILIVLTSLIFLFTQCDRGIDAPLFFTPDKTELSFEVKGGSEQVNINSNQTWSATVSDVWITLSPSNGKDESTLTITVEKNVSQPPRTGFVVITTKERERITIHISQDGEVKFGVNTTEVNFTGTGGEEEIKISSNVSWTATSDQDWITITPANGDGDASVLITAAEGSGSSRTGTVSITPELGDRPITISVSQSSTIFSTDISEVSFPASGGGKNVAISSNVSWTATSDQDWITITPASGTGDASMLLTATENFGMISRTGTITLTTETGESVSVSVTQEKSAIEPLFPGSDFEDWGLFEAGTAELMKDFAVQSVKGTGVDGGSAMSLSGVGLTGTSTKNIFRAKVPAFFSWAGKSKISFYIKGTTTPQSIIVMLYHEQGNNNYYTYNLGTITTEDVVIEPEVGATATSNGRVDYTGTIDTQGKWVKVSLNISPDKLIYGYRTTVSQSLIAFRQKGDTEFNLLIDNIVIE